MASFFMQCSCATVTVCIRADKMLQYLMPSERRTKRSLNVHGAQYVFYL